MSRSCADCGCKVYNGACVNCEEEIYIEEQMADLEMTLSAKFQEMVGECRKRQEKRIKELKDEKNN